MPGIEGRPRRALVVVGLLVAAAVVIAVQYSRLGEGAPAPTAGPDDPPPGVQLIYALSHTNPFGVVAYDWNGARRGSIQLPTWVNVARLRPAPDGSGFMYDPSAADDYAGYFDRLGRTQMEPKEQFFAGQVWASDNRHICVLETTDRGPAIVTRLPGHSDRLAYVATAFDGASLLASACNVGSDTAILQAETGPTTSTVVTLKLSTGAVLGSAVMGSGGVVVSRDGAYVAAGSAVYRSTDLATPVARFDPGLIAGVFSGDDSLLLTGTTDGSALEVLDWKKGARTWRRDLAGREPVGPAMARPASGDFAIAIGGDILVVRRNGQTINLANLDAVAW